MADERRTGSSTGTRAGSEKRRVLLVEDNADYTMLISDSLESRGEGYSVTCVNSPEKALDILDQDEFDLVLLDYKFPKGNGMEIIRKLKGKARFTPAVMITAFGNEEVAIEAMREGALDFLPKTRDFLHALPNVVQRVLERSEIIRERIRNREALERRNRELHVLNRIASLLNQSLRLDAVLEAALDQVLGLTQLDAGWVLLREEEGDGLQVVAAIGGNPDGLDALAGRSFYREVLSGDRACLKPGAAPDTSPERVASHLLIPLPAGGKVLGVLHLVGPVERTYPWSEMELLTGIGRQVGVAVENALLYQQLEKTTGYLEDLVKNAGDAIVTFDRDGKILTWNNGAAAITGYRAEEILGGSWEKLVPEDRREETRKLLQEVLEGRTVSNFETMRLHRKGHRLDVAMTLSPLRDEEGQIIGISSLEKDLTKRKQLQDQLIQVEKMAAIGQLISGVAHELNNPLTAVIGYSQLVSTARTGEKLEGYLEKISVEAMRCQRIVQNLLTFAREHKPEKRLLDLNEVLQSTVELRRYELRVRNVEIDLDLGESLPLCHADYHQLQQVFMNLIINAEHAMQAQGGGTLRIRSEAVQEDGEPMLRVSFSDTGQGIEQEILQKIFEPFFTTKGVGEGTGLGLSLSYGVVRSHEGTIYARNNEAGGASFVVELPAQVFAETAAGGGGTAQESEEALPSPPPKRILIVDDEPNIRDMFQEVLRMKGHEIDLAENGRSALSKIAGGEYDLIIADLKMPELGGEDLYRELRASYPHMAGRVMFATGDVISSTTRCFLEQTGNAVISKPCGASEIQEKVNEFFHHGQGPAAAQA